MFRKNSLFIEVFVVVVLVSLTVGMASAAALVTQSITYQGKLTDPSSNPLNGTYDVTFKLYEVSSGGTALATDTHTIQVSKGVFTTQVTADKSFFDGRALWLGIKVGADPEMMPREELRPVPYALSLRPGVLIRGLDSFSTMNVQNIGGGTALDVSTTRDVSTAVRASTSADTSNAVYGTTSGNGPAAIAGTTTGNGSPGLYGSTIGLGSFGVRSVTSGNNSHGISILTTGRSSRGVDISTTNKFSNGLYANTQGDDSHGIYSSTSGARSYGVYAYSTGPDSPGVYGASALGKGVYGNGVWGGFFETNQAGSGGFIPNGIGVNTAYDNNRGIIVETKGINSPGISSLTYKDGSTGVSVSTLGANSPGVSASTSADSSNAIYGSTSGNGPAAIAGVTLGKGSPGIYARTSGLNSPGVWAETSNLSSPGMHISTIGGGSPGVDITTGSGNSVGLNISTKGALSTGVSVDTVGEASYGMFVKANGISSPGIVVSSTDTYALWAHTLRSDQKYGITTPDYLFAKGTQVPASDVAEYMPVSMNVTPGTVLVIGEEGKLQPALIAYDTRVIGIVSTDPGVTLGTKIEGNSGEAQIAVAGRVPCKVDATKTPIHSGDLLTTSDNPGYAMKAVPDVINGHKYYPDGAILGKAMGSLERGTGTIEVIVTLQ
jgi:hypothetical protein